jgi:hypothetical protein
MDNPHGATAHGLRAPFQADFRFAHPEVKIRLRREMSMINANETFTVAAVRCHTAYRSMEPSIH